MASRGSGCLSAVLSLSCLLGVADPLQAKAEEGAVVIDTHVHVGRNFRRSPNVAAIIRGMDAHRVEASIVQPPPFPMGHPGRYGWSELEPIARDHPARFAFVAGGESLNPLIHDTPPDKVTPAIVEEFRREAEAIAASGAAGFGELTAEHFSSGRGNHPYESTRPDHPLFLLLADIAARHGMPIDFHMEAVPRDMPFPENRPRGRNPETVRENLSAFERLLAHNRAARIVWAHAGWDLTGERTPALMGALLSRHPNLYMSVKLDSRGPQRTSALDPSGAIRTGWLALLRNFPDRFMIGSDQFYDEDPSRLTQMRRFVDALPGDISAPIARDNARRVYRLRRADKQ